MSRGRAMNSIKSRLILALGLVEFLTLAMALIMWLGANDFAASAHRTRRANDDVRELLGFALVAHRYMEAFGQSLGQRTLVANHERRTAAAMFHDQLSKIGSARDQPAGWQTLDWKELGETSKELDVELRAADALREQGEFFQAERRFGVARSTLFEQRMLPWFSRAIETLGADVNHEESRAIERAAGQRIAAAIVGCVSALLASVAVFAISRSVLQPVKALVSGTEAIGRGEFGHRITHESNDEFALLSHRFNEMAAIIAKSQLALVEKNSRLEEAYRLQGEFVSVVSHELRAPLHAIRGYIEFIDEDEPALTPQSRKNLASIAAGAERLLALINDILDFSKLEARQMQIHIQGFELSRLMHAVFDDARAFARGRQVRLVLDAPSQIVVLESDEGRLRQILTNLLSNAIKFTPHGQITFRASPVANGVEFRIKDTGLGIPRDKLALIFEPFRQVNGERAAGGTGLGLAIVKRLASLIGAEVAVDSEVGKGTEFCVLIPMREGGA
jgi:signal transduction histidine kinase